MSLGLSSLHNFTGYKNCYTKCDLYARDSPHLPMKIVVTCECRDRMEPTRQQFSNLCVDNRTTEFFIGPGYPRISTTG